VGGTHLYGRRLVVEYAKDEEGLDELRAKTAAKYRDEEEAALLAAPGGVAGAAGRAAKRARKG
jgi:multiple RNA-binding domain-containing protein 1